MELTWTLAYRKPHANKFHRVTNWAGTWTQAFYASSILTTTDPKLEVWYVPSLDAERIEAEEVAAGTLSDAHAKDFGNVLVDSGRRVRMTETGTLTEDIISKIPPADQAQALWSAGAH